MLIGEKEARDLCNSVEIILVENSYANKISGLTEKKIKTRLKNAKKAEKYWENRHTSLKKELDAKKKAGKQKPILPEMKMESFKRKSQLFGETAERYESALKRFANKSKTQSTKKAKPKSLNKLSIGKAVSKNPSKRRK